MIAWRRLVVVPLTLGVFSFAGCEYDGLNSLPLPGTEGHGAGSYEVTLTLANAVNLVPNSAVLVDDLDVGSVRTVELDGLQPKVTIRLNGDIDLPENVTAKIGQTSLLGAKHIELLRPPADQAVGHLADGDVLGPEQTGSYPATEDVLASTALLLNGGGLAQIKTITTELNKALGGRTDTVRSLLHRADELTAGLDAQKSDIITAIESLNQIAGRFRSGNAVVARALKTLPPALEILAQQRKKLVQTLQRMGGFGVEIADLIARSGDDLVHDIAHLDPAIKGLADAGDSLVDSLWLVGGVSFPLRHFAESVRGDFINLWASIDLGLDTLDRTLLAGTPLQGTLGGVAGLLGQVPSPNATTANDPLLGAVGALLSALGDGQGSGRGTGSGKPGSTPAPGTPSASPSGGLLGGLLGGLAGGVQR